MLRKFNLGREKNSKEIFRGFVLSVFSVAENFDVLSFIIGGEKKKETKKKQ